MREYKVLYVEEHIFKVFYEILGIPSLPNAAIYIKSEAMMACAYFFISMDRLYLCHMC